MYMVLRPPLQHKQLLHLKPANISFSISSYFLPVQFHIFYQEMSLPSKIVINSGNSAPKGFRPCLLNLSQDINTDMSCWPEHCVNLWIGIANAIWKLPWAETYWTKFLLLMHTEYKLSHMKDIFFSILEKSKQFWWNYPDKYQQRAKEAQT